MKFSTLHSCFYVEIRSIYLRKPGYVFVVKNLLLRSIRMALKINNRFYKDVEVLKNC